MASNDGNGAITLDATGVRSEHFVARIHGRVASDLRLEFLARGGGKQTKDTVRVVVSTPGLYLERHVGRRESADNFVVVWRYDENLAFSEIGPDLALSLAADMDPEEIHDAGVNAEVARLSQVWSCTRALRAKKQPGAPRRRARES